MRGLFITGTDTEVGKTVASAALFHRYRGIGVIVPLRYWKPIQTGIERDDDTAEVRRLGACTGREIFMGGVRLEKPLSPHLAAKLAAQRIDMTALREVAPMDEGTRWIVEGAGGVLVPINETESMSDWISMLGLPVLIVSRTSLGTINHTLLTLEALRTRRIHVAGVLMIGQPNSDNRAAIEHYGRVNVVGEMPRFEPLSCGALADWSRVHLDPAGALRSFLE